MLRLGREKRMAASTTLHGRVAIVTGGTGGIGSAVVKHLASLGANTVVGYIGEQSVADELVSTINSDGNSGSNSVGLHLRAIAVEADVSDPAQVKNLFDQAQITFGPIHILVTTAAVVDHTYSRLGDLSLETWDRTFNTNCRGTFLCCREAANRLVRGGGGRIITFSSSSVGSLRVGYSAYSASKGAVEIMTKILARELKGTMITVNSVAPGPTATPFFYTGKSDDVVERIIGENPMNRLGLPEDVAPLVGFLASDAGEWVNAQVIRISGGDV